DLMKMIVHDLKTPLTSILASLELLLDGDLGPLTSDQQGMAADADGKAQELLRLIEDLLEIARIEEAALPLSLEAISASELLEEVLGEWSVRFQQDGATATVDVADDVTVFEADRGLLKRVFANLVQNALTHSARSITLKLTVRRDPSGVLFTVADNGPGIPPQYHELIFRKFEQVRAPNAPRVRSSGLGLAFCRLVVEQHGGRIWVQSAEGLGSAFHILLPQAPKTAEFPVVTA
ncbi:MAG TPA: ATP-binding protein, partial [Polyangiaceae bacterium]|nr:ATP-binding protein [Polyangiaceae bacterium]